jgi:hypothetical protein
MKESIYNQTPFYTKYLVNWVMTKEEAWDFENKYLGLNTINSKLRLEKLINRNLDFSDNSIVEVENFIEKLKLTDEERYSIIFDYYLYFGHCLMYEAKKYDNKMFWTFYTYNQLNNSYLYRFEYNITGFTGKYKGHDPILFPLIKQIFENENWPNKTKLSEIFRSILPYTHKKAPKK